MTIANALRLDPVSPDLFCRCVEELFRALRMALPLVAAIPAVLAIMLWSTADHRSLVLWLAAVLASNFGRYLLARHHLQQPRSESRCRTHVRLLFIANLIDGCLWGSAAFLFFLADSVSVQVLVYTLIVGLAAGSIMAMAYWPAALYAFAVPAVGLAALRMGLEPEPASRALAILLLLFLAILFVTLHMAYRGARSAIELQFANRELIEQLKLQKETAEQANLAKSKFLAAASHDLRQPLHALELFVSVLSEKSRDTGNESLLASINRSLGALSGLFQSLLDVSRLDAGVISTNTRDFALSRLFEPLIAEHAPVAHAKGLTLSWDGHDARVHSDPALVERMLRNLLSNAIRYTPGGFIRLGAESQRDGVLIHVTDSGIGIPADQQREIFEEFVQLHNPERDREQGLGLGLAIVRRLALLLHTEVKVASSPGSGSTFSFTLARARDTEEAETLTGSHPPKDYRQHLLGGRVILVIEDEAAIREAMRTLLSSWGCRVLLAEDLTGALAAIAPPDSTPDVVVADYRLRDRLTGAEAIQAIESHLGRRLPGVVITGDTAPERIREAQAAGYVLLHKPVQAGKLRALLTHLTLDHTRSALT